MKYSTIHQKMNEIFNRIPIFGKHEMKINTWETVKKELRCFDF